jgi:hypothetical protein
MGYRGTTSQRIQRGADPRARSDEKGGIAMSIEAVKDKYEPNLMKLPNVAGVGIGERAGKPVIKVFVTTKMPESALRPGEVVPKRLEGFETDVEEIGVVTAQSR